MRVTVFVATVDAPSYRRRLEATIAHLRERGFGTDRFPLVPIPLIDATNRPNRRAKVLMQGWRDILVRVMRSREHSSIVLVLEDDARLARGVDASLLVAEATATLNALRHVDIVSLGHAWRGMATDADPRHVPLRDRRANVHGTTCLALRADALPAIDACLSCLPVRRLTHLDAWFFQRRPFGIALRDPPLVGWASDTTTLTTTHAHGVSPWEGGRHGSLPPPFVAGGEGTTWLVCDDDTVLLDAYYVDTIHPPLPSGLVDRRKSRNDTPCETHSKSIPDEILADLPAVFGD